MKTPPPPVFLSSSAADPRERFSLWATARALFLKVRESMGNMCSQICCCLCKCLKPTQQQKMKRSKFSQLSSNREDAEVVQSPSSVRKVELAQNGSEEANERTDSKSSQNIYIPTFTSNIEVEASVFEDSKSSAPSHDMTTFVLTQFHRSSPISNSLASMRTKQSGMVFNTRCFTNNGGGSQSIRVEKYFLFGIRIDARHS